MSDEPRDRLLLEALAAGIPWWLAKEAVSSTRMDRDDRDGTWSVDVPLPDPQRRPPTAVAGEVKG